MDRAKIFLSGRPQAVRFPKRFQLMEGKFAYGGTETPSFSSRFADWQRLNSIVPES
jgi:hypothetical protein